MACRPIDMPTPCVSHVGWGIPQPLLLGWRRESFFFFGGGGGWGTRCTSDNETFDKFAILSFK